MKRIFLIFIILFCVQTAFAQNMPMYNRFFNEGKRMYADSLYYEAINQFSLGIDFSGQSQRLKDSCYKWIDLCGFQLQQLKQRADSLLQVARVMQRRVETAMFDKAVKQHFPEWKGFANYYWNDESNEETKKGLDILQKIDSLDLSANALLRVPQEVAKCKNLKLLNLLGNPDIDWKQSTETFAKLGSQIGMYVSVYDLSAIDSTYWHLVTGIELLQKNNQPFDSIPANILHQKQLVYLDLSGSWNGKNKFGNLLQLFSFNELRYLNLAYCSIDILPAEIENLQNLTELDLSSNQLTTLPVQIQNLKKLLIIKL